MSPSAARGTCLQDSRSTRCLDLNPWGHGLVSDGGEIRKCAWVDSEDLGAEGRTVGEGGDLGGAQREGAGGEAGGRGGWGEGRPAGQIGGSGRASGAGEHSLQTRPPTVRPHPHPSGLCPSVSLTPAACPLRVPSAPLPRPRPRRACTRDDAVAQSGRSGWELKP